MGKRKIGNAVAVGTFHESVQIVMLWSLVLVVLGTVHLTSADRRVLFVRRYAGASTCASTDTPHSIEVFDGDGLCTVLVNEPGASDEDDVIGAVFSMTMTCNPTGTAVVRRLFSGAACQGAELNSDSVATDTCFSFSGETMKRYAVCGTPAQVEAATRQGEAYPITFYNYVDQQCTIPTAWLIAYRQTGCHELNDNEYVEFEVNGTTVIEHQFDSSTCAGQPDDSREFEPGTCLDETRLTRRSAQSEFQVVSAFVNFARPGSTNAAALPRATWVLLMMVVVAIARR